MKGTPISIIASNDLVPLFKEVCKEVATSYGLSDPAPEFIAHMVAILKKYYGYLNIEQLINAFELNSMGYLNEYLPRSGMGIDNKVKFTIPDTTKIIKAFVRYKELDKQKKEQEQEWSTTQKNEINHTWCNQLETIFAIYRQKSERTSITLPTYTAEVLAKVGLIDKNRINYQEYALNFSLKKQKNAKRTHNENIIYDAFDALISKGQSLSSALMPYRERYTINSEFSLPF